MTVYDYREITLKDDLCLEISRDTDIENPRENDCNAATFYCLKSPRRKIGDTIDSAYYLNETKQTLAKTDEYAILPIYIYEHSGIALRTYQQFLAQTMPMRNFLLVKKPKSPIPAFGLRPITLKAIATVLGSASSCRTIPTTS